MWLFEKKKVWFHKMLLGELRLQRDMCDHKHTHRYTRIFLHRTFQHNSPASVSTSEHQYHLSTQVILTITLSILNTSYGVCLFTLTVCTEMHSRIVLQRCILFIVLVLCSVPFAHIACQEYNNESQENHPKSK